MFSCLTKWARLGRGRGGVVGAVNSNRLRHVLIISQTGAGGRLRRGSVAENE